MNTVQQIYVESPREWSRRGKCRVVRKRGPGWSRLRGVGEVERKRAVRALCEHRGQWELGSHTTHRVGKTQRVRLESLP